MPISAPATRKISATTMKRKTGLFSVDAFIVASPFAIFWEIYITDFRELALTSGHSTFGATETLSPPYNAAVERSRGHVCNAAHVQNEMAHLRRPRDAVSRSAATAC
jgi:hypothetical protein